MLEFLLFPLAVSGTLVLQDKITKGTNEKMLIEKVFKNIKMGISTPDHQGKTNVLYPKLVKKDYSNSSYHSFFYKLPSGMSFRVITSKIPLDIILEDNLNRDVLLDFENGLMEIRIYKHKLPKEIPFTYQMLQLAKNYSVLIGFDHDGEVLHDFNIIPHAVIGGMTRYGKSVIMKSIITQLVLTSNTEFYLFDLKGGLAFNRFKDLPQVKGVARNELESLQNLRNVKNKVEKRQQYFLQKGYEDIGEAWKHGEKITRQLIIVDEASVLAPQKGDNSKENSQRIECRRILEFIAQVAGGLGFNLIMCSQYPTGDILPRQVKQNADAKISLRLGTDIASKVILDEPGADEIPKGAKGRAIYKTDGKRMIQVPYMNNDMIDDLLQHLRIKESEQVESEYTKVKGKNGEDPYNFG